MTYSETDPKLFVVELAKACIYTPDPGPCGPPSPRYYYDVGFSSCRLFYYGGCLGNGNRFSTKQECAQKCPGE